MPKRKSRKSTRSLAHVAAEVIARVLIIFWRHFTGCDG
jgi:hypothetical protein